MSEKFHEKRVYTQSNHLMKAKIATVTKKQKQILNENKKMYELITEGTKLVESRSEKNRLC